MQHETNRLLIRAISSTPVRSVMGADTYFGRPHRLLCGGGCFEPSFRTSPLVAFGRLIRCFVSSFDLPNFKSVL